MPIAIFVQTVKHTSSSGLFWLFGILLAHLPVCRFRREELDERFGPINPQAPMANELETTDGQAEFERQIEIEALLEAREQNRPGDPT